MIRLALSILFLLTINAFSNIPHLELKKMFFNSINNSINADKLYYLLKNEKYDKSAIVKAYLGGTLALRAKHSNNPVYKLSYLKEAMKLMDNSILMEKNNVEIRFLRFSIGVKTPSMLGYNTHFLEDKNIILKGLKNPKVIEQLGKTHVSYMVNDILKNGKCNSEEKSFLKNILEQCNQMNH